MTTPLPFSALLRSSINSSTFLFSALLCTSLSLSFDPAATLMHSFVLSHLDYCNVILFSLRQIRIPQLKSVFHGPAVTSHRSLLTHILDYYYIKRTKPNILINIRYNVLGLEYNLPWSECISETVHFFPHPACWPYAAISCMRGVTWSFPAPINRVGPLLFRWTVFLKQYSYWYSICVV